MRDPGGRRRSAARWNRTALIWLVAFWAPVLGAYAHLLGQASDRLAADAALVYVAALAAGLAVLTAACVGAHALLIAGVRWLATRPEPWRRPVAAGLCVAVGWLLAYEWTAWATRLAHAFGAPQPLPDALAHAIGVGIALAYLAVGLAVASAPLFARLPAWAVPTSAAPRLPAPAASASRLIAPAPYPLRRPGPNAPAFVPAPVTAASAAPPPAPAAPPPASPAAAAPTAPRPAAPLSLPLDTPLVLRYPARPTAPPAPAQLAEPPAPEPVADGNRTAPPAEEVETLAELAPLATPQPDAQASAAVEPRVVPVVVPRREPRTVPVVPPTAAAPTSDGRVRISTEVHMEPMAEDAPPA